MRLSRSDGIDLTSGEGLAATLDGVDVIVEVTNASTIDERPVRDFFTAVARNLQQAATGAGVRHVITLSIVGIDNAPFGYYNAKLAHEREATAGSVPSTILRAT